MKASEETRQTGVRSIFHPIPSAHTYRSLLPLPIDHPYLGLFPRYSHGPRLHQISAKVHLPVAHAGRLQSSVSGEDLFLLSSGAPQCKEAEAKKCRQIISHIPTSLAAVARRGDLICAFPLDENWWERTGWLSA